MASIPKNGLTAVYIKVWRKVGATYNLIGTSENLLSKISAGTLTINTIDLASPITGCMPGDYVGFRLESTAAIAKQFYARGISPEDPLPNTRTYQLEDAVPGATDYDWEAQTTNASCAVPIEMFMAYPEIVYVGDSIMAGFGYTNTYTTFDVAPYASVSHCDPAYNISGYLYALNGKTYQNLGVGGDTTTRIAQRYISDIINMSPKLVILEGGINDVTAGVSKATFIANWTTVLSACQAAGIKMYVLTIFPASGASTANARTIDDWNASLKTLAESYGAKVFEDCEISGPVQRGW